MSDSTEHIQQKLDQGGKVNDQQMEKLNKSPLYKQAVNELFEILELYIEHHPEPQDLPNQP